MISHIFPGSAGKAISLDLHQGDPSGALLIFSHGFKGFKDYGPFPLFGQKMAEAGLNVIRFNFSHNGTSPEQPDAFVDLEAFGNNNFSIELDDLGLVIDWAFDEGSEYWNGKDLFLLGHSRGGAITILKAAEDDRVKKLATWASISRFGRFWTDEAMKKWEEEGVMFIANARTGQQMPMYWQMYEDFYANEERLDIPVAVEKLQVPFLCIHGTADETVKFEMAEEMAAQNPERVKLVAIEGAGHTFGWKHPWESSALPQPADEVLEETVKFFG